VILLNILTIDLEDWYHVLDNRYIDNVNSWKDYPSRVVRNTQMILDVLDQKNQKATFFCLGWVAEQHPSLILEILRRGHELGSHSYRHKLAFTQSKKEFREDLYRSINILQDISGSKIKAYRAPGFSVTKDNPWVFEELIEIGITHDCSVFPANRAHGGYLGLPDKPFILDSNGGVLKCLPMNRLHLMGIDIVFSGGGYFRLFNYQIIKQMMLRSDYVMTYFHPRDFDLFQPLIPGLSLPRKFKSYVGLKGALHKFERLINEFNFCNVMTASENINWIEAQRIKGNFLY
jgi:peptidoglycan-N-acetylglucosamine deacetylase